MAINLLLLLLKKEDNWIFKIDDPRRIFSIDNIIDVNNEYTYQYEIRTIPKKEISGNVLFLFFDDNSKEWMFEFQGYIKNVEEVKIEERSSNDTKNKFLKITFNKVQHLQTSASLSSLMYSLKNIKDYQHPWQNINLGLNKISDVEYKSIVDGEIYYSRTVFYKLFESMAQAHRMAFYNQIFDLSNRKDKIENNYSKLLKLLQEYIEKNIYKSSQLFVESIDILKRIDSEVALSEIGFDDIKNNKPVDYLIFNYEESKKFISLYEGFPSLDEFKTQYSNFNRTENEFYKIFKNRPFPMELL